MSRKARKFKGFFLPKSGDLKKKKRSSPKFRKIFLPISQIQTFEGGSFRMGGGYFPFFTENRPQKHKKHAILHTSQANGGWLQPPPLATLLDTTVFNIFKNSMNYLLQAKVQNSKRKAVNISKSNTLGISYDCNASEGVRNPSFACRFA